MLNIYQASYERETAQRLNQELALSTTHRCEVESNWRQTLRKEKYTELYREIPLLSEHHEQNVKRKTERIRSTQNQIDYIQDIYRKAMVANILRMDELIKFYNNQVIHLQSAFREKVERFQNDFRCKVEHVDVQCKREREIVQECILKQQRETEYMAESMKRCTQHEVEEIKNRNLEDINNLRFISDSRLEDLEEQFEQASSLFAQNTDTKGAYNQLQLTDSQRRQDIQKKTQQADRLQNEVQRVQLKAKQETTRQRELHQTLLERKTRAIQKFILTQDEMATFRKDRRKELIALSRRANEKKESLKRQCVAADRVKRIAMACRKLETSRDQLASLLRDSLCIASSQNCISPIPQTREEPTKCTHSVIGNKNLDINTTQSILLLDTAHRFWDKYNMARLDVLTLAKLVVGLKRREQLLRGKLKIYQDGINVNDDVLKNQNPLLVINGKMNVESVVNERHV